jgi:glycosyltransferase involved in cell wall biosynthesis
MTSPLVSVIIPVYNGEIFLADAIRSVVNQDYEHVDLIVVDDGSTDRTAEIARSFPAARYVYQHNQGHGPAKNTGIRAARGEMLAFLDADDFWLPDKLTVQAGYLLDNPVVQYVTCHFAFFRSPDVAWPSWVKPETRDRPQPAYIPSALLARRTAFESIGTFNPALWHGNDADWILRARDAGMHGRLLPQVLFQRRVHADNLSNDTAGLREDLLKVLASSIQRKAAHRAANE